MPCMLTANAPEDLHAAHVDEVGLRVVCQAAGALQHHRAHAELGQQQRCGQARGAAPRYHHRRAVH
jgi:hypothetical protein